MTTKVAIFLAHALAMEQEAADRYDELADSMEVHNNKDVAELFRQMAKFSRLHGASVAQRATPYELPKLKSWQYRWNTPEPPEVGEPEGSHYMMTPYHALIFALDNEKRGQQFYASEASGSDDPTVRVWPPKGPMKRPSTSPNWKPGSPGLRCRPPTGPMTTTMPWWSTDPHISPLPRLRPGGGG